MVIFDSTASRLRLQVGGEYTRYPRLCRHLLSDILHDRSVKLKGFVWDHILHEQPIPSTFEHQTIPILKNIQLSPRWSTFTPTAYRLSFQDTNISQHRFQKSTIRHFWYCPLFPHARTVFYRTLHKRIPTQVSIHKYNTNLSLRCSLCGEADDTFRHFVVDCPKNWDPLK